MKKNDLNEKGGMRIADIPTYHKHAKLNQENQFLAYFKQKKKLNCPMWSWWSTEAKAI